MKKSVVVLFILVVAATIWADDYKILEMNSASIKIGNRTCKSGDVFSDKSIIYWKGDKQAFKAQNVKTKEIHLFAAPAFQTCGSRTVKEFYVKNNHLSTRGGLFNLDDLAEEIGDTLYLWERMKLESPYLLDSTSYFYVCYQDSIGQNNQKILESDKDSIVIDENILKNGIIQNGIYVSLRYTNTRIKEDCAVKDSLFIYIIPNNY